MCFFNFATKHTDSDHRSNSESRTMHSISRPGDLSFFLFPPPFVWDMFALPNHLSLHLHPPQINQHQSTLLHRACIYNYPSAVLSLVVLPQIQLEPRDKVKKFSCFSGFFLSIIKKERGKSGFSRRLMDWNLDIPFLSFCRFLFSFFVLFKWPCRLTRIV